MTGFRAIVVLTLTGAIAHSQESIPAWQALRQTVKAGDRVQIDMGGRRNIGTMERVDPDGLRLRIHGKVTDYSAKEITRVYKLSGRTRRSATWALIGFGVGAGGGAGLGAAGGGAYRGIVVAVLAVVGAAAGTIAGAALGGTHPKKTLIYEQP